MYDAPASPCGYQFFGNVNLFHGRVRVIGPLVRRELEHAATATLVEVDLSRKRYQQEEFISGEAVFLRPARLRVFAA